MGAVLQSEVRLHEGILASLTLQAAWNDDVPEWIGRTTELEEAIASLKAAIRTDGNAGRIPDRLLNLLFNLEELIQEVKATINILSAYRQKLASVDTNYISFIDRLAGVLAEGVDWMEDLAETWSLSLDEGRMADVKGRLVEMPKAPSEIRDWRAVLEEFADDAKVQD
jgi:hypothetical protein